MEAWRYTDDDGDRLKVISLDAEALAFEITMPGGTEASVYVPREQVLQLVQLIAAWSAQSAQV